MLDFLFSAIRVGSLIKTHCNLLSKKSNLEIIMKKIILFLILCAISIPAYSQSQETATKPNELLTQKEADIRIKQKNAEISVMQATLDSLKALVQSKNDEMAKSPDSKQCNEELMKTLGVREFDVNNFKEKFGKIEARTKELAAMQPDEIKKYKSEVDALKKDYDYLKNDKSSLMPDIYERVFDLSMNLTVLADKIGKMVTSYVVGSWAKDKDCLWSISAKEQIYADPLMWPKIWQANTDKISNPDVLKAGTELTIPDKSPKSDEELKAERLYWRKKKGASKRK